MTADRRLKRINSWVHREYMRLFERCLAQCWSEWVQWPAATREPVLCSVVTFINGLRASAVANPTDWRPERQLVAAAAAAAAAARLGRRRHERTPARQAAGA